MSTEPVQSATTSLQENIAVAAYYIWEKEGRVDGHDTEHWQRAKTQLLAGDPPDKAADCDPPPQNITNVIAKVLPNNKRPQKRTARVVRSRATKVWV